MKKRRPQKRRRPVLAGTRRLPQETDSVVAELTLAGPAELGNENLRPRSAASSCEGHLVEPAHVAHPLPAALRRFRPNEVGSYTAQSCHPFNARFFADLDRRLAEPPPAPALLPALPRVAAAKCPISFPPAPRA